MFRKPRPGDRGGPRTLAPVTHFFTSHGLPLLFLVDGPGVSIVFKIGDAIAEDGGVDLIRRRCAAARPAQRPRAAEKAQKPERIERVEKIVKTEHAA